MTPEEQEITELYRAYQTTREGSPGMERILEIAVRRDLSISDTQQDRSIQNILGYASARGSQQSGTVKPVAESFISFENRLKNFFSYLLGTPYRAATVAVTLTTAGILIMITAVQQPHRSGISDVVQSISPVAQDPATNVSDFLGDMEISKYGFIEQKPGPATAFLTAQYLTEAYVAILENDSNSLATRVAALEAMNPIVGSSGSWAYLVSVLTNKSSFTQGELAATLDDIERDISGSFDETDKYAFALGLWSTELMLITQFSLEHGEPVDISAITTKANQFIEKDAGLPASMASPVNNALKALSKLESSTISTKNKRLIIEEVSKIRLAFQT